VAAGPSRDYWSQKLLLPWVHSGTGDWLDAQQQTQGSLPYATATVAPGLVTLPVTKQVNRWLSNRQNRGVYLKTSQAWPNEFAGRTHSGTQTLECTSNAAWTPSSYMGKDSRGSFSVAQENQFAALQFDLSSVAGPVKSAHLALTSLSQKYPGPLEVFELNSPEFRVGKGKLPERLGIANGFVQDSGIAKHPSALAKCWRCNR
jgi:hypothetical protein